MPDLTFSILNTSNQNDINQYEKALFRAFYSLNDSTQQLVWDVDKKAKTIKTRISYTNQDIFVGKVHGSIISGVATNCYMHEQLQLELFGFTIDKSEKNICEGLALFNLQVFHSTNTIALLLRDFVFKKLKEKNIVKIYGTCSQNRVRGYQILGWRVVDCHDIGRNTKYLIEYSM